jgi:formate hydrogenlyase transcriptional activator
MDNVHNCLESQPVQERLRVLAQMTNRFAMKQGLPELLREVTAATHQLTQCDSAGVVVPDPETRELLVYASDPTGKVSVHHDWPLVPMAERVLRSGQPANPSRQEISADPALASAGIHSCCQLPLNSRGRVVGVFGLASSRENAFAEQCSFLGLMANQVALSVENALAYGEISRLRGRLSRENVYLENEIETELHFEDIVGESEALRRVLTEVNTVAPTDSTVLICGETGTGKELIARAVHKLSSRKTNPFVKLNCAAIPTGLLESELFGHEKGAFTGAFSQRAGRFEVAHGGTIFLDEIGEIPLELQPKLLRVLQEREFERLGSSRTLRTDARLIAATNQDLKLMVEDQHFRSDLYYRLNVFPVRLPPLRERQDDIPALVRHFVQEFSRRNKRHIEVIPSETMDALLRYDWPGNVRELQNVLERAVIISQGPVLHVPAADLKSSAAKPVRSDPASFRSVMDETERTQILHALEESNWVISGPAGAAARLGLKRTTLQARMHKLGIRLSRSLTKV